MTHLPAILQNDSSSPAKREREREREIDARNETELQQAAKDPYKKNMPSTGLLVMTSTCPRALHLKPSTGVSTRSINEKQLALTPSHVSQHEGVQ